MELRVKVDLWLRGNHRRGDVVDLPIDQAQPLIDAGILERPEDVSERLETRPGVSAPNPSSEALRDPKEALSRPSRSASTEDWAAYAGSLGFKTKGLKRAQLIALVENNQD